jgi:hypothetical protein
MKAYPMPLSVQLLAMSQSSLKNISGFIKTKGKTHFTISDSQAAQVVILDIDNQEGRDLLLGYQTSRKQTDSPLSNTARVIALSLSPKDNIDSSIIQIKKPITGIELIRAAEKIQKMSNKVNEPINQESSGSSHAYSDPTKPKENSKVDNPLVSDENHSELQTYDPSETLQGMLEKAIQLSNEENTSAILHIQRYCIEINVAHNKAYLNFPKTRLRNLCYVPLNTSTCRIEKGSLSTSSQELISLPITELSWNTTLQCSRGRLPKNLNDQSIYQLKRWPNLTRWAVPNNALSIASLWSKSPYSITAISQQLSIPIADVRCFITAAINSQLAIICEEVTEIIPFKAQKKHSTLFKKLLNHLKRD